jgi:DNA-binding MarR family transcriptional regulator
MHRKGLVEWVRSVHGRAIAIRITDTGRTAFAELKE